MLVPTVISEEGMGFAALKMDGTAVAWGDERFSGITADFNETNANELNNIKTIFTNRYTFAALKNDGTVYTWGRNADSSGTYASDSSGVQDKLNDVVSITGNSDSMAALKSDGTVVAWGEERSGGDTSVVWDSGWRQPIAQDTPVKDVKALFSTGYAYAALTNDDTVITWGNKRYGGDSSVIFENSGSSGGPEADTFTDNLTPVVNIKTIVGSEGAFAALTHDGKVITWGGGSYGGYVTYNNDQSIPLTDIDAIYATDRAFAAVNGDGEVITWGQGSYGGDSNLNNSKTLDSVKTIASGQDGFAALKNDGSIAAWGASLNDESNATGPLTNIIELYSSYHIGFAGINQNREAVYWGYQGDQACSEQQPLVDIDTIVPSEAAYAALTYSGNVITWGVCDRGGDSSAVQQELTDIQAIYATEQALAAVKLDGTGVVTWGTDNYGGDSSEVKDLLVVTEAEYKVAK